MQEPKPRLYEHAGEPMKLCRGCNKMIFFHVTNRGSKVPVNPTTGRSHFEDCPSANSFSGRSRGK